MAQDKYIVALQIADKDLAKKLTIEEATLLGSLAEGGHTISNDLATREIIQGGKKIIAVTLSKKKSVDA